MKHAPSTLALLLLGTAAVAQTPPAPTLPQVTMPTVISPASAPENSGLPAMDAPVAVTTAAPPAPAGEAFSYGEVPYSILYAPGQLEKMKKTLALYETARRNQSTMPLQIEEEQEVTGVAAPDEPARYPVFTLKSIVYRDARDWTVWIGSYRITPRTNQQEVQVVGVTPNNATFLWKPPYAEALVQRHGMNMFASRDSVKHKTTSSNNVSFDNATGQVTFSLRPNQTFVPGYMATFEGKMAAPTLPALDGAVAPAGAPSNAPAAAGAVPGQPALSPSLQELYDKGGANSSDAATLDTLLKTQQNMNQLTPKSAAPNN